MDKIGLINLAKKLVEQNQDNLNNPEGLLRHLELTYEIAEELVNRILSNYPNIPLVGEEISLASGLHDFGRPLKKDQLFHELRGAAYVEQYGLELKIAHSQKNVYRIAQMIRPHGFLYERWIKDEVARKDFEKDSKPVDIRLLLPRTWQEAIVTYCDDHNDNGEIVPNLQEKYVRQLARYREDPLFRDGAVVKSIIAGQKRVTQLCEKVEALAKGELSAAKIGTYGFL